MATNQSLFPTDSSAETDPSPELLSLNDAGDVFEALRSGTARSLVDRLHDDPATASELARATDTSLQNVQYHLGRLRDAGVVEVVDTSYSERGREMEVFAQANDPLVIFSEQSNDEAKLKQVLAQCR